MLAAPKQREGQLNPHLLNVSYSASEPTYEAQGFRLEKQRSDVAAYHLLFKVFYGKHLLAHLYSDPTKKYGFNCDLRPLHVCNEAFYTMDYAELLTALFAAFDFKIHNHSHLHVCLFTQDVNPAQLIQLPRQYPSDYILINGTQLTSFTSTDASNTPLITTYINQGSKRVEGVIYNKTKQLRGLKRGKQKQYILDWFEKNGMDTTKDIYSFELKIHAKALSVYKPLAPASEGVKHLLPNNNGSTKATRITQKTKTDIEIHRLQHPSYLAALFEQFLNIDIRNNDRSRPSNCTRVQLVNFNIYGCGTINKTVSASEQFRTTEKRFIKYSLQALKDTNDPSYLFAPVELAIRYNLQETLFNLIAQLNIPNSLIEESRPMVGETVPKCLDNIKGNFNRLLHLKP